MLLGEDNRLIHKVNPPQLRLVVSTAQAPQNDPGSSQGGGLAYEGPPKKDEKAETQTEAHPPLTPEEEEAKVKLAVVVSLEQIGLGEVVREFQESKKSVQSKPGLTTQYQSEGNASKGLLLNKKAE